MRLIDADALKERLKEYCIDGDEQAMQWYDIMGIDETIDNAPTIDAVPVVRCKDCRWWSDGMQMCGISISATPYGHCHDGETLEEAERKDDD